MAKRQNSLQWSTSIHSIYFCFFTSKCVKTFTERPTTWNRERHEDQNMGWIVKNCI